jgi:hypothetical protein
MRSISANVGLKTAFGHCCTELLSDSCTELLSDTVVLNCFRTLLYWTTFGHCCTELLSETAVLNYFRTLLCWTAFGHCCTELLSDTVVLNYFRTLLYWTTFGNCCTELLSDSCTELLSDTVVLDYFRTRLYWTTFGHCCTELLSDTVVLNYFRTRLYWTTFGQLYWTTFRHCCTELLSDTVVLKTSFSNCGDKFGTNVNLTTNIHSMQMSRIQRLYIRASPIHSLTYRYTATVFFHLRKYPNKKTAFSCSRNYLLLILKWIIFPHDVIHKPPGPLKSAARVHPHWHS